MSDGYKSLVSIMRTTLTCIAEIITSEDDSRLARPRHERQAPIVWCVRDDDAAVSYGDMQSALVLSLRSKASTYTKRIVECPLSRFGMTTTR